MLRHVYSVESLLKMLTHHISVVIWWNLMTLSLESWEGQIDPPPQYIVCESWVFVSNNWEKKICQKPNSAPSKNIRLSRLSQQLPNLGNYILTDHNDNKRETYNFLVKHKVHSVLHIKSQSLSCPIVSFMAIIPPTVQKQFYILTINILFCSYIILVPL